LKGPLALKGLAGGAGLEIWVYRVGAQVKMELVGKTSGVRAEVEEI